MRMRYAVVLGAIMFGAGWTLAAAQKPEPGGYILERDAEVATAEPGAHHGGRGPVPRTCWAGGGRWQPRKSRSRAATFSSATPRLQLPSPGRTTGEGRRLA